MDELAERHGVDRSYVGRMVKLGAWHQILLPPFLLAVSQGG
jgi:hypothetical protein